MMNANEKLGKPSNKRLALVVEDNDINREILCALLEEDFEVLDAENGLVGLEHLEKHSEELSLILLDVYMPLCDGFEFLRRMRSESRYDTIPVVVCTASDATEDEIKCLKLGANDFVLKPYNFEIMINRVNNLIRLRESASIVNQLTWDNVTGLYSKDFFYRGVEDHLAVSPDQQLDLICTDIENFRMLNDRYGETNCDKLLRELALHLSEMEGLIIGGRIGADVFAFLVEHREGSWENGFESVSELLPIPNVNVKIGVVDEIDHAMPIQQTCNRAISALETVKGFHGVSVAYFTDELYERQELERAIRDNMEEALEQYQFSVFFQPKHNVHVGKTGGAEALVRWIHPEIGFISPGVFITVFERNGFITKLDMFVWEEACKEIRRCQELNLPLVPISVNASALDFDLPDLPQQLAAIADKHGVDHQYLHVELTETAYADDPDRVASILREIRELGFHTELDDFGSGYSSLASLNTLPLDVMKLDMSMIRQATKLNDFRIIESTINLAQVLGMRTVVEGVETQEEATRVTEIGCDLIQGYFYSKPLKQDEFEQYLERDL